MRGPTDVHATHQKETAARNHYLYNCSFGGAPSTNGFDYNQSRLLNSDRMESFKLADNTESPSAFLFPITPMQRNIDNRALSNANKKDAPSFADRALNRNDFDCIDD